MVDERQQGDVQEVMAARVGALLAIQVERMMNPKRDKAMKQRELIETLYDRGLTAREIFLALGISRNIIDPTLSRYRKSKKRPLATESEGGG